MGCGFVQRGQSSMCGRQLLLCTRPPVPLDCPPSEGMGHSPVPSRSLGGQLHAWMQWLRHVCGFFRIGD